jgi:hypothetical protein
MCVAGFLWRLKTSDEGGKQDLLCIPLQQTHMHTHARTQSILHMSQLHWSGFHAASRVTFLVRAWHSVLCLVRLPAYCKTGRERDQTKEVKRKGRRELKKGLTNREK